MRQVWLITLSLFLAPLVQATPSFFSDGAATTDAVISPAPAIIVSTFPTELTVEGLISLSRSNFPLQMGAFKSKFYADDLCSRLEEMLNIDVEVINEAGLFKVRINTVNNTNTTCYFIPVAFPQAGKPEKNESQGVTDPEEAKSTPPERTMDIVSQPDSGNMKSISPDTVMASAEESESVKYMPEDKERGLRGLFFMTGDNPWLNRYSYFGKSIALVNALIFTIIVSVVTMIILLIVILLNRTRMEKEAKLRQYLLEKYQGLIVDYLFGDTTPEHFRAIASDIYRREVLIDEMIDVSVNLKGEAETKLNNLYRELKLDKDSVKRAHSRRWHVKIKGFRELAFMNIKDANTQIYKALNSKNEILRMEAQIALVRLSDDDPFTFLSHLKRPFSLWEQITLHELIIHHELPLPDFQKWLPSSNPTVVMFALRMIREFKQKNAEPEVRKALLHRDPRVSQLAVEVAGDLNMRSTLDTMKRMYKFQEYSGCLEIVKSMGKMPDPSMMGFLKLVLDKEDDVQLQIEATKAIENMGEEGVKALVKIMKSEYKNYNIIVRHVLDRRIY